MSGSLALVYMCAPIANYIGAKIGTRKCLLLGSFFGPLFLGLSGSYPNFVCVLIFYGILFGPASCLMINPLYFTINRYYPFDHPRHVLANSLLTCGYPVGSFILNPVLELLISNYGWQKTFAIHGLILFATCFPSSCMIVDPHQLRDFESKNDEEKAKLIPKQEPQHEKQENLKILTRVVVGICWFLATCLRSVGYSASLTFLVCK